MVLADSVLIFVEKTMQICSNHLNDNKGDSVVPTTKKPKKFQKCNPPVTFSQILSSVITHTHTRKTQLHSMVKNHFHNNIYFRFWISFRIYGFLNCSTFYLYAGAAWSHRMKRRSRRITICTRIHFVVVVMLAPTLCASHLTYVQTNHHTHTTHNGRRQWWWCWDGYTRWPLYQSAAAHNHCCCPLIIDGTHTHTAFREYPFFLCARCGVREWIQTRPII